jgi:hypothetical protein
LIASPFDGFAFECGCLFTDGTGFGSSGVPQLLRSSLVKPHLRGRTEVRRFQSFV